METSVYSEELKQSQCANEAQYTNEARQSQCTNEVELLSIAINTSEELTAQLENKLNNVLDKHKLKEGAPDSVKVGQALKALVPLASELRHQRERIAGNNRRLRGVLGCLEN